MSNEPASKRLRTRLPTSSAPLRSQTNGAPPRVIGVRLAMGALVALAVTAAGIWLLGGWFLGDGIRGAAAPAEMEFCRISRTDLPIAVTEAGVLESQSNDLIRCKVGDVPGDGVDGTAILWIVPNGSQVQAGDLLVEWDSSHHRERLDRQFLAAEQAPR